MQLFCFASKNLENIWRGVKNRKWAVASVSDSAMKGRITNAERNFGPGSRGLLDCNPRHAFMVPFVATSKTDPLAVEYDIWPEPWRLPFSIRPLGDPRREVSKESAKARWPMLIHKQEERGPQSISAAMHFTGTTVFVPVEITDEDWRIILDDLAIEPEFD